MNFKQISRIESANDLIDTVLSYVQRKTPTQLRPDASLSQCRMFYNTKVSVCLNQYSERVQKILTDFPRIDEIHPFYSFWLNVNYSVDHVKLALGKLRHTADVVKNTGMDNVKLIKQADSKFRCRNLKKSALGRMTSIIRQARHSLAFLERVRQHMARLPAIAPERNTLLLCGFPSVGKSSFINQVSNAAVEVQPHAFTTKSLYLGHTTFSHVNFQIIDTPGILDRQISERNRIEMQAMVALAYLDACVLFIMDLSGQCHYTIEQQCELYRSLTPTFEGKPILLVLNKTDIRPFDELPDDEKAMIEELGEVMPHTHTMECSALTSEGVMDVRNKACQLLLDRNNARRVRSSEFNKALDQLHVGQPERTLEAVVPVPLEKSEMDLEDGRKQMKDYVIPEIFNGKNVIDFYDPNIEELLAKELEIEQFRERPEPMDRTHSDPKNHAPEKIGMARKRRIGCKPTRFTAAFDESTQEEGVMAEIDGEGNDSSETLTMKTMPKKFRKADHLDKKAQWKYDRSIVTMKPKHLYR
ncbi:hypothetical protein PCE1_002000 [Barthelona sp. PCE]